MKREKSCGAVIIKDKGNNPEVLLIQHVNGGHWAFPKGHVEQGETETGTALREIREETGLSVRIDDGFRSVSTYSPGEGILKDVIYFIAQPESIALCLQAEEVKGAGWFSFEEALKTITYENDRRVLREAAAYLGRGI